MVNLTVTVIGTVAVDTVYIDPDFTSLYCPACHTPFAQAGIQHLSAGTFKQSFTCPNCSSKFWIKQGQVHWIQ